MAKFEFVSQSTLPNTFGIRPTEFDRRRPPETSPGVVSFFDVTLTASPFPKYSSARISPRSQFQFFSCCRSAPRPALPIVVYVPRFGSSVRPFPCASGGSAADGMSYMDHSRRMLAQFRDLFNGLAPRQRITLVAAPLLVLAGLGLLVSRNDGLAEEPLLSGKSFTPDEIEQARLTLHKGGLFHFRVDEQRLVVPRDEVPRYNAALIAQTGMPSRFGESWNQALNRKSLLPETDRQRQDQLDIVRAEEIVTMIKQTPQIADARLAPPHIRQRSSFAEARRTALLSVTPREGIALSDELYRSLQRIVAGAWSMTERDVTVFNTRTGLAFNDTGAVVPHGGSVHSPQNTSEPVNNQAEIAQRDVIRPVPPGPAPGNKRPSAANRKASQSRSSKESRQVADLLPQWVPPASGAVLALLALAVLRRTRRRLPQSGDLSPQVSTTHSADVTPESTLVASIVRAPELVADQRKASLAGPGGKSNESLTAGGAEPQRDEGDAEARSEQTSPTIDENSLPPPVPLQFLHAADPDAVLSFVSGEHPQTIALILSNLPAPLAAKVLRGLPSTKQLEVGRRVATSEEISPEVLDDVAKSLRNRIASTTVGPFGKAGGSSISSPRLNRTDRVRNHELLESLELEDSALADRIRRLMFVFDDLLKLDGSAVASLFARVDSSKWALALKGASEELKSKILDNLSTSMATRLQEELDEIGPVRLSDVAAAQQQIVALVRRLEDSGEIVVDARTDALRMIA